MFSKQIRSISLLMVMLMVFISGCMPIQRPAVQGNISLPIGFRPEGIALGAGSTFFVGSLGTVASDSAPIVGGAIYRGDLVTGEGKVLIAAQPNQMAVGVTVDRRTGYLFVAGGMMGDVRVYDSVNGKLLARYAVGAEGGFVNDLVVTQDALYATDSFVPILYRVPLATDGKLLDGAVGETIQLSGEYAVGTGEYPFQANGIVVSPDGNWLIIVNSDTGKLYRVDPATGAATTIDLADQNVAYGDGLVLDGQMLYVVQNYANQLSAVKVEADFSKGSILATVTTPAFDFKIPTTAIRFGDALYVVNGRYEESAPLTVGSPEIEYGLLQVPLSALR